jgi:eukaryotic-like serine/threonine-protein kinase
MDGPTSSSTESLVAQVISTWRAGLRPDAAEFLARHPHLRRQQGVTLDLAYEEYCLRREAGERLSRDSFCDRFPSCRRSLGRLLAIHECANEDASLASDLDVDEAQWPAVGAEFLGFDLLQELGRGAFAHVYLARQPALGNRLVVAKVAQHGRAEAETLGRLAHRNIVPVYSVSEDPATHMTAVCMPYLGSATLLDILDAGFADERPPQRARFIGEIASQEAIPLVVPEMYTGADVCLEHGTYVDGIVHLAVQLADALHHTHEAGICHRDLKPSNVLLTPSGCPMLLDFNLSSDVQLEQTVVGGTLPYMSPEQLRDMTSDEAVQDADADPRADLFSLGVILYEMLTGHLPFGDREPGALPDDAARQLLARQETGCPPLRRANPQVNARLARVVQQCLDVRPERRPPSAQALADALRRQLATPARLRRWVHRRRFLLGGAVAATGLMSGIVAARVAARIPTDVREYDAGIRAFQAHEWDEAIDHFSRVQAARPEAFEPPFALGQVYLARGDTTEARDEFVVAYALSKQRCTAIWLGYGYDCAAQYSEAEVSYAIAVNEYGHESVEVWNNRGFGARNRDMLPESLQYLDRAIELDPLCQTPYYNRALTYAKRNAYQSIDKAKAPDPTSPSYGQQAIQDIERAIALGPVHNVLMLDAAVIYARDGEGQESQERAVRYLKRAIDLGYDPQEILKKKGLAKAVLSEIAAYPAAPLKPMTVQLRLPPPNWFPPLFAH